MSDTDTPAAADGVRPGGVRLLSAMGRHWLIVLLALIHGLGLGIVATMLQDVTYASTTQLLMEDPRADGVFRSVPGSDTGQRLSHHANRITSDSVLIRATEMTASPLTVEQLRDRVSVDTSPTTGILRITVVDESRRTAVELADAVAAAFEADLTERALVDAEAKTAVLQDRLEVERVRADELRAEIERGLPAGVTALDAGDPILAAELRSTLGMIESLERAQSELLVDATVRSEIEEVQPAQLAAAPQTPTPTRNLAYGLTLGLLAGVLLAWWRAEKHPAAERAGDPAPILRAPCLGIVGSPDPGLLSRAKDAGRWAQVVGELSFGLTQQNLTMVSVVAPTTSLPSAQVAANLAAAASRQGWRVLLVDADLGDRTLTDQFQGRPALGLSDVAAGRAPRPAKTTATVHGARFSFVGVGNREAGDLPRPEVASEVKRVVHDAIDDENLVIVATSPVSTGTEAAAVVNSLDGVIAVVPHATPLPLVEGMRAKFAAAASAVLGYVFVGKPSRVRRVLAWPRAIRHTPLHARRRGGFSQDLLEEP